MIDDAKEGGDLCTLLPVPSSFLYGPCNGLIGFAPLDYTSQHLLLDRAVLLYTAIM